MLEILHIDSVHVPIAKLVIDGVTNPWTVTRWCGPKSFHFIFYSPFSSLVCIIIMSSGSVSTISNTMRYTTLDFYTSFGTSSAQTRPQMPPLDTDMLVMQNQQQKDNTSKFEVSVCHEQYCIVEELALGN